MLLPSLALGQTATTTRWYGPATASFTIQFPGNPYDPDQNDVRVQFIGDKAQRAERLAYYDEAEGAWRAVLVAEEPGTYRAVLVRNGKPLEKKPSEGFLEVSAPLPHGFVRRDARHPTRFAWDDGTPYVPVGFNLGWQSDGLLPLTDQMAKAAKAGANWSRIWACAWDGKNPWAPGGPKEKTEPAPDDGQLWSPALERWQEVVDAADKASLPFQFVLFHHGEFSSTTDANWPQYPWNAKNGGFLAKASDFFTNAEAKRRSKMWLRYAVARYGASPNVLAWELFNEVQWVDAVKVDDDWPVVEAWHKEMADYLRSIDPYHHLVTSSSVRRPALDVPLDYVQPHTYPANVVAAIAGERMPETKPGFFGEFGPGNPVPSSREVLRDGLYAGLLSGQSGAGEYWYWDVVEKEDLYGEYAVARKVLDLSGLAEHPDRHDLGVAVSTPGRATLSFAPGMDWGKSTRSELNLPGDLTPSAIAQISRYRQGTGNPAMNNAPLVLRFRLNVPSEGVVRVDQVSRGGATLVVRVNGKEVARKPYSPHTEHTKVNDTFRFPLPAGASAVEIANAGSDWFTLADVSIGGLAPQATALMVGEVGWAVVRVTATPGAPAGLPVTLQGLSVGDGDYDVTTVDLATGTTVTHAEKVENFALKMAMPAPDVAVILKRRA